MPEVGIKEEGNEKRSHSHTPGERQIEIINQSSEMDFRSLSLFSGDGLIVERDTEREKTQKKNNFIHQLLGQLYNL